MTQEQVDIMMRDYKTNKARCEHLRIQLLELETNIRAEIEKAIAEDSIHAQQYSDLPHATDITRPVEELVMKYLGGYTPPLIQSMREEHKTLTQEHECCASCVGYVDGWMIALGEREQKVIRLQVLEGLFWRDILVTISKQYGNIFSQSGLRKIKRNALKKIYTIAG